VHGTIATGADNPSYRSTVSGDGRYVAFESVATNLVAGFVNGSFPGSQNVFLFDRVSGTNELVSRAAGSTVKSANYVSLAPTVSDDGVRVLFASWGSDLVSGQVPPSPTLQAFLFDRAQGSTRLVSHASVDALRSGSGILSGALAISGDGRYAAFASYASDLVANDTNGGATDAFLFGPVASLAFHTLDPCRAVDTREADAPALAAGATRTFLLRGRCGLPATAEAVAINLTVLSPGAPGFLTLFAAGQIAPPSSNANIAPGQVRANNGIVALGTDGGISVLAGMASGQVDVLIDLVGYFE
jgi:hypothetical protein